MDSIRIKGSNINPLIICDANQGLIEIKGVSIGEDPLMQIYSQIFDWLDQYQNNYQPKTIVNIHLGYINSSSSRSLLNVFKKLKKLQEENIDASVVINWYYNEIDEDMHEAGEVMQDMVKLQFNFIAVKK